MTLPGTAGPDSRIETRAFPVSGVCFLIPLNIDLSQEERAIDGD